MGRIEAIVAVALPAMLVLEAGRDALGLIGAPWLLPDGRWLPYGALFLVRGLVILAVVGGLLTERRWARPAAIAVLVQALGFAVWTELTDRYAEALFRWTMLLILLIATTGTSPRKAP